MRPTDHASTGTEHQGVISFQQGSDASAPGAVCAQTRLIDSIIELNPSASPRFLRSFSAGALASYLDHLALTQEPRGNKPWVRHTGQPAIVAYRPTA